MTKTDALIEQMREQAEVDREDGNHQAAAATEHWADELSAALAGERETAEQLAERIARFAHKDQKDTVTGAPYIEHVERVVRAVDGSDAKVVAWLHDVLEDAPLSAFALEMMGVSWRHIDAVELLTRCGLSTYAQYIDRIAKSGNGLAIAVKLADLRDHLTPNCPERLRPRYEKALEVLLPVSPSRERPDEGK